MTKLSHYCSALPNELLVLSARFAIAAVFWRSAQTKFSGWKFLGQDCNFTMLVNERLCCWNANRLPGARIYVK